MLPCANVLCWCLMPNHFHLMLSLKDDNKATDNNRGNKNQISSALAIILRSYARAIQKQEEFTGSLFQQKTKSKKLVKKTNEDYLKTCFHYIHQNPFKAGLVKKMEDWEYSSFRDYIGLRKGTICNSTLARELLDLPASKEDLCKDSYNVINSTDDFESSDE